MSRPLSGIRIVDLGLYVAGPYASVPLGDLGAEVIKIEPLSGDPNRTIWRAFACCNRGKRAISLDLKSADGLKIAREICVSADVVHHNFRPGVLERIGLGYESLKAENPDIIYFEASAYGSTGPLAQSPGFDMIMQALCGHEAHGAGDGNVPLWMRWAPVDFTGGYLGTIGILAALYRRQKENRGGVVRSNLLDGGIYMLSELIRQADKTFTGVRSMNAEQTGTHPASCLYRTSDGWVAVVARSPEQHRSLALALSLNELAEIASEEWDATAHARIAEQLAALTTDQVIAQLTNAGVWAEPCRHGFQETLFSEPSWQATGMLREHTHPRYARIRHLGNMARFSNAEAPVETGGLVAEPGEHTREILGQFGYSDADIDDFYQRKIVA